MGLYVRTKKDNKPIFNLNDYEIGIHISGVSKCVTKFLTLFVTRNTEPKYRIQIM